MWGTILFLVVFSSAGHCNGHSRPDNKDQHEEVPAVNNGAWFTGVPQMQDLTEVSWEYMQDLQCWLWPEKCEGDQHTHSSWDWPNAEWKPLQLLSDWYSRVIEDRDLTYGRITNNLTGLQWDLGRRVHGQHLAVGLILSSLEKFLREDGSKKPLTLSFHGWTGTGKNLAAKIIAENLYKDGQKSLCIRVFIPQLHFPHLSHMEAYKAQLAKQITEVTLRCLQPLFVFDEADKIPVALLDSLLPFLRPAETHKSQSIFIFLSAMGANGINEVALNFWRAGRHREEITADDTDRPLKAAIKRKEGDMFLPSRLLQEGLIDAVVPFLPLERAHVKLCARDCFVARGLPYTETALQKVIQELLFVPKEEQLFSAKGCKLVAQRIYFMEL
ncbi:torsin-3A [Rhinophrynus dorsalis]